MFAIIFAVQVIKVVFFSYFFQKNFQGYVYLNRLSPKSAFCNGNFFKNSYLYFLQNLWFLFTFLMGFQAFSYPYRHSCVIFEG